MGDSKYNALIILHWVIHLLIFRFEIYDWWFAEENTSVAIF